MCSETAAGETDAAAGTGIDAKLRLARLQLTDFRNYAALTWCPGARISALFGPNGSGKTNLLEAVSLLVPGRGLRSARTVDMARLGPGASGRWAVAGRLATAGGPVLIETGILPEGPPDRRVVRIDGSAPRSQSEIAARVAAVWLTPQMDRLFQEPASGRRRFLDRLVWALEPAHAREIAAHDAAMSGRNRLLATNVADLAWLAGLEDTMARHAVAATAARMSLVTRLGRALAAGVVDGFPPVRIALECRIASRLASEPAIEVEEWLRHELAARRLPDKAAGSAGVGAHRCDMVLTDLAGMPAGQASTGEQKAMLLTVILGHAGLIAEARGFAPLLLLDEPAVHLDPSRRRALFAALERLPAQVLLTGTDPETFLPLADRAEGLRAGDGRLVGDRRFSPRSSDSAPVARSL
ncbi:MAG TPA: DNA replication/repair protein RecF [Acetobacteraceae bacterium]